MKSQQLDVGLTTTKAPFIENARNAGELFITQPYELYSDENQIVWNKLYNGIFPLWEKYANPRFLEGIETLQLKPDRIPILDDINRFLNPLTGFKAKAVSGYIPGHIFFESLSNREFPTTITIRDGKTLNYLPEPDIFHDVAGHVPMHTHPVFADVLVKFGSFARKAADRFSDNRDKEEACIRLHNCLKALSRVFWFTVEFGIMREKNSYNVYGSGLLSSPGEIVHCVESPNVQRYPFQLEWVVNQSFKIDRYQVLLFVIESFDHLFEEVNKLEKWLNEGKLDYVAPGEPRIDHESLLAFLNLSNS